MGQLFKNNWRYTLTGPITDTATTIPVGATAVNALPVLGADHILLTIDDGTNVEIVKCTAGAGSDLTVTRGQEDTAGVAFSTGAVVEARITAATLTAMLAPAASAAPEPRDLVELPDCDGSLYAYLNLNAGQRFVVNHTGGNLWPVLSTGGGAAIDFTKSWKIELMVINGGGTEIRLYSLISDYATGSFFPPDVDYGYNVTPGAGYTLLTLDYIPLASGGMWHFGVEKGDTFTE